MRKQIVPDCTLADIDKLILSEIENKEFWGDIAISFDEYEVIRSALCEELKHHNIEYICRLYPVSLVTFLVFLARYKYDINFWGLMSKEMDIPHIDGLVEKRLGDTARLTFDRFHFNYSAVKDEKRVNIAPIIYQAGIPPESSLDDLFYILSLESKSAFEPQVIVDDILSSRAYQIRKPLYLFFKQSKMERIVEYMVDIHDAIISVNQNRIINSSYATRYSEWKNNEKNKSTSSHKSRKDFQCKPYLIFDTERRGLCMKMPKTILEKEWIDEVFWDITTDSGWNVKCQLNVVGDDEERYVDSLSIPVMAAQTYSVRLMSNELGTNDSLVEWNVFGIDGNAMVLFNSNGRMVTPRFLDDQFMIVILPETTSINSQMNVVITEKSYPTSCESYKIYFVEPLSLPASISITTGTKTYFIETKINAVIRLSGTTLFKLPCSTGLFTSIPSVHIKTEEEVTSCIEIQFEGKKYDISSAFFNGVANVDLSELAEEESLVYGHYSVSLYQNRTFVRQLEFNYIPTVHSNYVVNPVWPNMVKRRTTKKYIFQNSNQYVLEFENCKVLKDEDNYLVECPPDMFELSGSITIDDQRIVCCNFTLPLNQLEVSLIENDKFSSQKLTSHIQHIAVNDSVNLENWINVTCSDELHGQKMKLQLLSVDGIEQEETILLSRKGSPNISLSIFSDTVRNSPLPSCLRLLDEESGNEMNLVVFENDNHLHSRPTYSRDTGLSIDVLDAKNDLIIKRFGRVSKEIILPVSESFLSKMGYDRIYTCNEEIEPGLYALDFDDQEKVFDFEEDNDLCISCDSTTFFINASCDDETISNVSAWLQGLINEILKSRNESGFDSFVSSLSKITSNSTVILNDFDYELLIALGYFSIDKALSRVKKESIKRCMLAISDFVLNGESRMDIVRYLVDMNCPQDVFDLCLENYRLILSLPSKTAKVDSFDIESRSPELALLLLMRSDSSIRDIFENRKYRALLGEDAVQSMLYVVFANDEMEKRKEQLRFLHEERGCCIRVWLDKKLVGSMDSIQKMYVNTEAGVAINKEKRSDEGRYFDHIKFVDQYINWFEKNFASKNSNKENVDIKMITLLQRYCAKILEAYEYIKKIPSIGGISDRYKKSMDFRYIGNPLENLKTNNHCRFFYLQGLAALLAMIPLEYRCDEERHIGEKFMQEALQIAPKISMRDLLMAALFIYFVRKEECLCQ